MKGRRKESTVPEPPRSVRQDQPLAQPRDAHVIRRRYESASIPGLDRRSDHLFDSIRVVDHQETDEWAGPQTFKVLGFLTMFKVPRERFLFEAWEVVEIAGHQVCVLPSGKSVELISVEEKVTDQFRYQDANDGQNNVQGQHFVGSL